MHGTVTRRHPCAMLGSTRGMPLQHPLAGGPAAAPLKKLFRTSACSSYTRAWQRKFPLHAARGCAVCEYRHCGGFGNGEGYFRTGTRENDTGTWAFSIDPHPNSQPTISETMHGQAHSIVMRTPQCGICRHYDKKTGAPCHSWSGCRRASAQEGGEISATTQVPGAPCRALHVNNGQLWPGTCTVSKCRLPSPPAAGTTRPTQPPAQAAALNPGASKGTSTHGNRSAISPWTQDVLVATWCSRRG